MNVCIRSVFMGKIFISIKIEISFFSYSSAEYAAECYASYVSEERLSACIFRCVCVRPYPVQTYK